MEEKMLTIEKYLNRKVRELTFLGVYINSEQIDFLLKKYSESTMSIENILLEIDQVTHQLLEDHRREEKLRKDYLDELSKNKELIDLPFEYMGITINNQDIDLITLASIGDLERYRKYQDNLISKEQYFKNKSIELDKKMKYILDSEELKEEDKKKLIKIKEESSSRSEIIEKINNSFDRDTIHKIYEMLIEYSPIEKSGIKSTTIEASNNLLEQIENNFNSLTIDQEAKYGSVALLDGTFDFRRLDKALSFCKKLGKEVRLNALIFYMDCPNELYELDKNLENSRLVKEKLTTYVNEITKFIRDNGYEDTVRSIDVFNELLNRFALVGDTPYLYRGDISLQNSDNTNAGWLKHLSIEDLCDVIAIARKNLPDVEFTYNDDNLEDPKKMEATREIITRIQDYERKNDIKLIDCIGSQMHIDNGISIEDIENMFKSLSKFNLPIEITEFDMAMIKDVDGLSDKEIEAKRQDKLNEIFAYLNNLRKVYDIRGLTIWSKTDSQNFRVSLENEIRVSNGLNLINTLHGGYFTENMELKSKELVKDQPYRDFNYHTHTFRCGHAGNYSDGAYVIAAKLAGLKTLGFSDHIPVTNLEYSDLEHRMIINEVDEYLESINNLKEDNPDMTILSGFEAEYDPAKVSFLANIREKVDYMILGQHFVKNGLEEIKKDNNPNYPLEYAKIVCQAIESGLFDIVAHPDIFITQMKTLDSIDKKIEFSKNASIASKMICEKAKEIGIPIELNFAGLYKKDGYPDPAFWKIASQVGVKVISGVDAHNPSQLTTMAITEEKIEEAINHVLLNKVRIDYNPVIERGKNKKLQEAFNKTRRETLSYDTYITTQLIDRIKKESQEEEIIPRLQQLLVDIAKRKVKSTYDEDVKSNQQEVLRKVINSYSVNDELNEMINEKNEEEPPKVLRKSSGYTEILTLYTIITTLILLTGILIIINSLS